MGRLSQMLYVDVSIRTSGFPAALGLAVAVLSGYGSLDPQSIAVFALAMLGIVLTQAYEHALDVLHDVGGYSAFRDERLAPLARRYVRAFPWLAAALALAILALQRPWVVVFGLVAYRMSKLYVASHNEWYAVAGFMSAYAVGYFSATNWPSLPFLAGFVLTGFIYKASLSMYRLDDYLEGELPSKEAAIQYYRNVFRYTLHYVPPLTLVLLLAVTSPAQLELVMPWAWIPWIAGFGLMAVPMLRYRAHNVYQEAPIHGVVAGIAVPDLAAAWLAGPRTLAVYIVSYAILVLVLNSFWRSRHAMCNIVGCPLNPLLRVERPR